MSDSCHLQRELTALLSYIIHVRYMPKQTSAWPLIYNQLLAADPPLNEVYCLNKKFEQEKYYHYFTTWEGEADLQPPINLCWCKIINPDLLA